MVYCKKYDDNVIKSFILKYTFFEISHIKQEQAFCSLITQHINLAVLGKLGQVKGSLLIVPWRDNQHKQRDSVV